MRGPEVPDAVRQQQERCVFGILHAAATLLVDEDSRRVLPGAIDAKHQREDYKSPSVLKHFQHMFYVVALIQLLVAKKSPNSSCHTIYDTFQSLYTVYC